MPHKLYIISRGFLVTGHPLPPLPTPDDVCAIGIASSWLPIYLLPALATMTRHRQQKPINCPSAYANTYAITYIISAFSSKGSPTVMTSEHQLPFISSALLR